MVQVNDLSSMYWQQKTACSNYIRNLQCDSPMRILLELIFETLGRYPHQFLKHCNANHIRNPFFQQQNLSKSISASLPISRD